jgi:branched-subunit amino acid transport protein
VTEWVVVAVAGALTYGIRLTFLVFVHHGALPRSFRHALEYVTPAVLAAVAAPAVLYAGEGEAFDLANARLMAAGVAAGIAWLSRNVWATIGGGMVTLWVIEGLL